MVDNPRLKINHQYYFRNLILKPLIRLYDAVGVDPSFLQTFFAQFENKETETASVFCGKSISDVLSVQSFNMSIHSFVEGVPRFKRVGKRRPDAGVAAISKQIEDFPELIAALSVAQHQKFCLQCRICAGPTSTFCVNFTCDTFWKVRAARLNMGRIVSGSKKIRLVFE